MAASNSNHRGTSGGGIQLGSAWFQRKINLRPQHRGVHLVTEEILRQMPELGQFSVGLCHVQSKHFNLVFTHIFYVTHSFLIIICNNADSIVCFFSNISSTTAAAPQQHPFSLSFHIFSTYLYILLSLTHCHCRLEFSLHAMA